MSDTETIALLRRQLDTFTRVCWNVGAQYERFKEINPFVYHVHPDSMRRIAAACRQIRPFDFTSTPTQRSNP